jgi:hypothetical protein
MFIGEAMARKQLQGQKNGTRGLAQRGGAVAGRRLCVQGRA